MLAYAQTYLPLLLVKPPSDLKGTRESEELVEEIAANNPVLRLNR